MSVEIIVSIITGACSIAGVIISSIAGNNKLKNQLQIDQAVTHTKIERLTEEVRLHNNFASRIPVLEEQIKVANHRIENLEEKINAE